MFEQRKLVMATGLVAGFVVVVLAAWQMLFQPSETTALPESLNPVENLQVLEGTVNARFECPVAPVLGQMWNGPVWIEATKEQLWGTFPSQPHPGAKAKCVKSNLRTGNEFPVWSYANHCEITEPSSVHRYPLPDCVVR